MSMKHDFPWVSSSTRLVLLSLNGVMCFLVIRALVTGSQYFGDVFTGFLTTIGTVVGFFFGQRETEHKTFAASEEVEPSIIEGEV